MSDPQTADHTADPAAPERSPLWESVGDDVLILHPDTNVVHHLTGDAATAATAVLRSDAVPSHLVHIADDAADDPTGEDSPRRSGCTLATRSRHPRGALETRSRRDDITRA